ncbi:MAG: glycine betaine ABC transporter substrate-binding protein [Clostridiaceae bacterium]
MNKKICLLLTLIIGLSVFAGCGSDGDKVVIGSKTFTENILLSEMYAQLIEAKTDIEVERKQNLGATSVCFPAIKKGEIDIYLEYTGTAYNELLGLELTEESTSDYIYETSKEKLNSDHDITMFSPIGINNTFALAMSESKAKELGIKTMSDLSEHSSDFRFGANHIFYTREKDGYDTITEVYSYKFSAAQKMDTSLLYDAVKEDKLDVIVVYATDSLLKKYELTILEDDKEVFPAYYGTPICRNETLEKHPELKEVLDMLSGMLDDKTMQELNYLVDVENKDVEDVAKDYLTEKGLL